MKLLILNSAILACDPLTQTDDAIHSADAIYPKHVIEGYAIVDADVPDGFTPAGYTWDGSAVVAKPVVLTLEEQIAYKFKRAAEYPPMSDYIDGIVKGDDAQVQAYIDACLAVKAKYPKPE